MIVTDSKPLAVVTGGSTGIGRELAHLADTGAQIQPVRADLATFGGVEQLLRAIAATGREVDAIALNAGVGISGAFIDVPLADEERLIDLNIGATVHLAKRILPDMVARRLVGQGRPGRRGQRRVRGPDGRKKPGGRRIGQEQGPGGGGQAPARPGQGRGPRHDDQARGGMKACAR